MARTHFRGEHT
jgi:hypothetical protein